jgi:hypothetical protein
MMMRRAVVIGVATAVALLGVRVIVACSEITPTTFGNPNTLNRSTIPGEGGVEELVCGADGGADASAYDGGCPSFAVDIYPAMAANGAWHCSDKACHGGASAPAIDGTNAGACLASLKKITVTANPYLSSDGGKNPNASSIMCNLQGACGSKMPKPPGVDLSTADLCKVQAWLKCGAPN